jgi:hypothetical protein
MNIIPPVLSNFELVNIYDKHIKNTGETNMNFLERLNESLEVADLAEIDPRLQTRSELSPISSKTKRVAGLDKPLELPLDVNVNLRRDKPKLSDEIIREADEDLRKKRIRALDGVEDLDNIEKDEDDLDLGGDDLDLGDDEDEGNIDKNGLRDDLSDDLEDFEGGDEELEDDDLEDLGDGEGDTPTDPTLVPTGGAGYTVNQAKAQIDGVIKQWMHLSGNYPEGSEEREKFQEIGERLDEISRVLYRDFIAPRLGVST